MSDLPINPPPPDVVENIGDKICDDGPLSEPPSPFLSKEIYLQCHRNGIEQALVARQKEALETTALLKKVTIEMDKIGSDISSSEDELLTGERLENNYSPVGRASSIKKDDDQMSLSSLSSGEQKIEEPSNLMAAAAFHSYPQYPGE